MSIQAVAWVLECSAATLADRLVLIAIANHADARGWNAWPSVPLIAAEAKVSESTVYRSLTVLEEAGEIVVHRRSGRPNRYGIAALHPSQDDRGNPSQIERGQPLANREGTPRNLRKTPRKLRPEPSEPLIKPVPRCADCGHLTAACSCGTIDKERSLEWVRALRQGETPA